jgi:hypothetical protein
MNFAYDCAKEAHSRFFSFRRGIWNCEKEGLFVLYDNHPIHVVSSRERVIVLLHEALAEHKVKVLAEAYYPVVGPNTGHTWVLVVDAQGTWEGELVDLREAAVHQSLVEDDA